jgi:hypothetical protein
MLMIYMHPGREKKNMLLFLVEERGVPIEQEFQGT